MDKKVLGKGLGSLIPMGNRGNGGGDEGQKVFECPIENVVPNQNQPRKLFNKEAIDELASSIDEKGVLQPLLVRDIGGGKYEIIAGERRYRASQLLQLPKIPVIVKNVEAQESMEIALIENLQREDLNPIEEALGYRDLISKYQYTQDELAKKLGKDRSSIANTLRLLKLTEEIRGHIISGKLSMGHARALLAVDDEEIQKKISDETIAQDLSVRQVEDLIRRYKEEGEKPVNQMIEEGGEHPVSQETNQNIFKNIEDEMKKILKTKVTIQTNTNGQKGKVVIHFHSREELDGLYEKMAALNYA